MKTNIYITQVNPEQSPKPTYATKGSAEFDLRADLSKPLTLLPNAKVLIPTGLKVQLPVGTALFLYSRSGLACNHGLILCNNVGVVDSDYHKEIKVCLYNNSSDLYIIHPQERIAQAVLAPVFQVEFTRIEPEDWGGGSRDGFGSTGRD